MWNMHVFPFGTWATDGIFLHIFLIPFVCLPWGIQTHGPHFWTYAEFEQLLPGNQILISNSWHRSLEGSISCLTQTLQDSWGDFAEIENWILMVTNHFRIYLGIAINWETQTKTRFRRTSKHKQGESIVWKWRHFPWDPWVNHHDDSLSPTVIWGYSLI